ncbi:speckle targeted PIP5K1A-regulated poly(A) polymerase-like isoform X2 [Bacillus rossius redtenbacheri]
MVMQRKAANKTVHEESLATDSMAEKANSCAKRSCESSPVKDDNETNVKHLEGTERPDMVLQPDAANRTADEQSSVTDGIADKTTRRAAAFICEICHVNVAGEFNLKQHLEGKKHAAMVRKLNAGNINLEFHSFLTGPGDTTADSPPDEESSCHQDCLAECDPSIEDFDSQVIQFMVRFEIPEHVRHATCAKLCRDIDECLRGTYPRGRAVPFGSVVTGLANLQSDIDVYFTADYHKTSSMAYVTSIDRKTEQKMVRNVRRILGGLFPAYQCVITIPAAKVALVKFFHRQTQVNCDLSFKNGIGAFNSSLVKFYLSFDSRIQPLVMVLKHWGRLYELTGTGHITNYALVWLVLYYLQQLDEPIAPPVAALQRWNDRRRFVDGWDCSFSSSVQWQTTNVSAVRELLAGFFRLYARFDRELLVICPLLGRALPKNVFCHAESLPPEMDALKQKMTGGSTQGLKVTSKFCVQDPFVLEHNVTSSVSKKLMARFQSLCSAAEKICVSSEQRLQNLFEDCLIVEQTIEQNLIGIEIFSCQKFAENLTDVCWNISVEDLKNVWYSTVYSSVVDVFENVLKCKVCDVSQDDEGSEAKVRKLDSQCDVSSSANKSENDFRRTRILKCSAYFCIWDVYKVATRDFFQPKAESSGANCMAKMSSIEKQKAITNFTMENFNQYFGKPQPDEANPVLSFTCQILPKQNPIHVLLNFTCDNRDKCGFVSLVVFLKKNLPKWIQEC